MRVLVIGSEGNIGKPLVKHLRACGHDVLRCDIKQGWAGDYVQADIRNLQDLYPVAYRFMPNVVYHLAAMVSRVTCEAAPEMTMATNVTGTSNVCQLCKAFDIKMINISTSEVYGNRDGLMDECDSLNPNNRYGLSKRIAEEVVAYEAQAGLRAITLRPFMFYCEDETMGEHRSAMIRFAEALSCKRKITVHDGARRSWLHMSDAVWFFEKVLYVKGNSETINIGHPDIWTVEGVAKEMCKAFGVSKDLVSVSELPERMTLSKTPNLEKQAALLGEPKLIGVLDGIKRIREAFRAYSV